MMVVKTFALKRPEEIVARGEAFQGFPQLWTTEDTEHYFSQPNIIHQLVQSSTLLGWADKYEISLLSSDLDTDIIIDEADNFRE